MKRLDQSERLRRVLGKQHAISHGNNRVAKYRATDEIEDALAGVSRLRLGLEPSSGDKVLRYKQKNAIALIEGIADSMLYRRNARWTDRPDWEVIALIARDYFPQMCRMVELCRYRTIPRSDDFRAFLAEYIENIIRKTERDDEDDRDP